MFPKLHQRKAQYRNTMSRCITLETWYQYRVSSISACGTRHNNALFLVFFDSALVLCNLIFCYAVLAGAAADLLEWIVLHEVQKDGAGDKDADDGEDKKKQGDKHFHGGL